MTGATGLPPVLQDSGLGDYLGAFANASFGLEPIVAKYKADGDDYSYIMAEALADRHARHPPPPPPPAPPPPLAAPQFRKCQPGINTMPTRRCSKLHLCTLFALRWISIGKWQRAAPPALAADRIVGNAVLS